MASTRYVFFFAVSFQLSGQTTSKATFLSNLSIFRNQQPGQRSEATMGNRFQFVYIQYSNDNQATSGTLSTTAIRFNGA